MTSSSATFREAAISHALRRCELFAGWPDAVLSEITSLTRVREVRRGECLFIENAPSRGFFIIQRGAIKLHRLTASGQEQVLHIFRPFESVAEETLFSNSGYQASACATEPTSILEIPKDGFLALVRRQPDLTLSLLRALGRQFDWLVALFDDRTLKDAQTRLANWLIEHCADPGSFAPQTVHLTESKRLLAAELGVASETFSRTLKRLRNQRLLSVQGRSVTLFCPVRLAHLARGEADDLPCPGRFSRPPGSRTARPGLNQQRTHVWRPLRTVEAVSA